MVEDDRTDFICPGCQARYKIVRAKSEPRSSDWLLYCKVCKQPLAATDGEDVLKYFLVSRRGPSVVAKATTPARSGDIWGNRNSLAVIGFPQIIRPRRLAPRTAAFPLAPTVLLELRPRTDPCGFND
jgi:hypothetical protein